MRVNDHRRGGRRKNGREGSGNALEAVKLIGGHVLLVSRP
jgi:hypothetical protein